MSMVPETNGSSVESASPAQAQPSIKNAERLRWWSSLVGVVSAAFRNDSVPAYLTLRILSFAVFLIVICLWLFHNQGWTYKQLGMPLLSGVLAVIMPILAAREKARIRKEVKATFFLLLRTRVALPLAALFVAVSVSCSSVTVKADQLKEREILHLGTGRGQAEKILYSGKDAVEVRFRTFTYPWGRTVSLSAVDCTPHSFKLRPWLGKRFHLADLLDSCYTVIFRVPAQLHAILGGGTIRIRSDGRPLAEVQLLADEGALLLGRKVAPDVYDGKWRNRLQALGLTGGNADRALEHWKQAVHKVPLEELRRDMPIHAEFLTAGGQVMAERQFVIEETIHDVELEIIH